MAGVSAGADVGVGSGAGVEVVLFYSDLDRAAGCGE